MKAEEYIDEKFKGNTYTYAYHLCKHAIKMARKEEREKAIKVFREMTCKMGIDIPCERCSSTCVIYKFKELLDKEI